MATWIGTMLPSGFPIPIAPLLSNPQAHTVPFVLHTIVPNTRVAATATPGITYMGARLSAVVPSPSWPLLFGSPGPQPPAHVDGHHVVFWSRTSSLSRS
jgi:hypothetical protein